MTAVANDVETNGAKTNDAITEEKKALRKAVLARRDSLDAVIRQQKSRLICNELSRLFDNLQDGLLSGSNPITVAIYNSFGSEANLDAFAQHVWDKGGEVAFPCMEKRPNASVHGRKSHMNMRLISRKAFEEHLKATAEEHEGTPAVTTTDTVNKNETSRASTSPTPKRINKEETIIPFLRAVAKAFAPDDPQITPFPVVGADHINMLVVPLVAFDSEGGRLGYGGGNYDEFLPTLDKRALVVGVGFEEQRVEKVPREAHDLAIPRVISA